MTDGSVLIPIFDVVLADDEEVIVAALVSLLHDHNGLSVVATASNGTDAASHCAVLQPHLAVLDVRMPGGGIPGMEAVQAVSPLTGVVFYTAQADRRTRDRLIGGGALAVFAKGVSIDLAEELHRVALRAFNPAGSGLVSPDQATENGGGTTKC